MNLWWSPFWNLVGKVVDMLLTCCKAKCQKILKLTWLSMAQAIGDSLYAGSTRWWLGDKKIGIFYCVFVFFVMRGLRHTHKRKMQAEKDVFFAVKFSSFQAFFWHVLICLMSALVSVSWNFEMLLLQTLPTKHWHKLVPDILLSPNIRPLTPHLRNG